MSSCVSRSMSSLLFSGLSRLMRDFDCGVHAGETALDEHAVEVLDGDTALDEHVLEVLDGETTCTTSAVHTERFLHVEDRGLDDVVVSTTASTRMSLSPAST